MGLSEAPIPSPAAVSKPAGPKPSGIVLCADDYGIAPGVGKAIRHLLSLGRLSATSCMTGSPFWPDEAKALQPFIERADIGLHLTLTDQRPLGAMPRLAPEGRLPSIFRMIRLAHSRQLDRREIKAELGRQLDRFEQTLGRPPDHLDGHQHVHQLPVVRDVVIEIHQERLARSSTYLRYCTAPVSDILGRGYYIGESLGISFLGRRFVRRARACGIPGNRQFSGIHDFSATTPYRRLFESFLKGAKAGLLIMCHPGLSDPELAAADRVTTEREEEYRYFLSDEFSAALQAHGVTISRLSQIQ